MQAIDLQLSSGRLRALRRGPAGGIAAVCVPGLSANVRSFDAVAAMLAERGRPVIALDLRGRGYSPATPPGTYGWLRHAQDVLDAARQLGFVSFDLVGHSMGAFVAMQSAALEPDRVRRLVLIDAAGVPEPAVIPPIVASVQRLGITYASAQAYCEQIRRVGAAVPWEFWEPHYLYDLEPVPDGVRPLTSKEAVLEDAAYGAAHDARLFWPALRMPTLLLRAARPLLPGTGFVVGEQLRDAFRAAVPASALAEIDANHYGVMAHAATLRAIDGFLG